MADVFKKAKKFASDSAKAKGNYNLEKIFLFVCLKSMTKARLFNLCTGERIVKINEKLRKNHVRSWCSVFSQVFH